MLENISLNSINVREDCITRGIGGYGLLEKHTKKVPRSWHGVCALGRRFLS